MAGAKSLAQLRQVLRGVWSGPKLVGLSKPLDDGYGRSEVAIILQHCSCCYPHNMRADKWNRSLKMLIIHTLKPSIF